MEGPEGPDGAVALVEVRRETGRRRVRPLSMVLGRASGHTRAGLLGTPAAQGAPSPSCRGASAVGVGGSLFTSGDGLVFPGELRPRQPSCCQEAGPGARELLGKSRSLEGQGRSSSRCFGYTDALRSSASHSGRALNVASPGPGRRRPDSSRPPAGCCPFKSSRQSQSEAEEP